MRLGRMRVMALRQRAAEGLYRSLASGAFSLSVNGDSWKGMRRSSTARIHQCTLCTKICIPLFSTCSFVRYFRRTNQYHICAHAEMRKLMHLEAVVRDHSMLTLCAQMFPDYPAMYTTHTSQNHSAITNRRCVLGHKTCTE